MKKLTKGILLLTLVSMYLISNWLIDLWANIGVETTSGAWRNLFNLDRTTSHHIAWYFSMFLYLVLAVWVFKAEFCKGDNNAKITKDNQ